MRSVDLRFSDNTYGLIQQEADALEVSVAQFSRVAVVSRAAFCAHRRGFAWGTAAPEETALRAGVGLGRAAHEPVRDAEHRFLSDHFEAEALVEAHVSGLSVSR
jgi:hypothetical protein